MDGFEDLNKFEYSTCPTTVSRLYKSIFYVVQDRQANDTTKYLIFCVAYTLYCCSKKMAIAELLRASSGDADKKQKIDSVFNGFEPAHKINEFVEKAGQIVRNADKDLMYQVTSSITEVAKYQIEKEKESQKENIWKKTLRFVGETLWHVWVLLASLTTLVVLATFAKFIAPSWVQAVTDIVEEVLKPFTH
jgi:hypothetical protein